MHTNTRSVSLRLLCVAITLMLAGTSALPAQKAPRLRLFLDCATSCDGQFLRTELIDVDWVTDRTVSDVHVIATGLGTGAGGREVTLTFLGREALAGMSDTVRFSTPPDATDDVYRREFLRVLELGLVRYSLAMDAARTLRVTRASSSTPRPAATIADPWNFWVFNVRLNGELDAESRTTGYDLSGEVNAARTTEDWKVRIEVGGNLDRTTFTLDDGRDFTAKRDGWRAEALVARSLNWKWSGGFVAEVQSYRPDNLELRSRVAPALEMDLYPYAEATRRRLILLATLGINHFAYVEETVFDRIEETRLDGKFDIAFEQQQPWGSAYINGSASAFLSDLSQNRLSGSAGLEIRLARGLEFEVNASYTRVRDQITLPKGDATDEEVFLRLRQLATGYRASVDIGLSYTFGSFLNTIVNPRFNDVD
jgi:hypothetical protein